MGANYCVLLDIEIFPIAYAIVNVEDKYNWKWCLTLLHQYLGEKK